MDDKIIQHCEGADDEMCNGCLRISEGFLIQQWYVKPAIEDGICLNFVSQDGEEEE